mgnify:CR=1 FL=1
MMVKSPGFPKDNGEAGRFLIREKKEGFYLEDSPAFCIKGDEPLIFPGDLFHPGTAKTVGGGIRFRGQQASFPVFFQFPAEGILTAASRALSSMFIKRAHRSVSGKCRCSGRLTEVWKEIPY